MGLPALTTSVALPASTTFRNHHGWPCGLRILADLGYRVEEEGEGEAAVFSRGPPRGRGKGERRNQGRRPARQARVDPHSPFAKLKNLKVPAR